jgi:phytoene synthase
LTLPDDFEPHLRRLDPDRWLSTRFVADAEARDDLILLYALDGELARIPTAVSEPLIGEIRFAWWREGLDEIAAGQPVRAHPLLQALAATQGRLPLAPLYDLIEARRRRLDPAPFANPDELLAWLDSTAGTVAAAAASRLVAAAPTPLTTAAARAWSLARLETPIRMQFTPEVLDGLRIQALAEARDAAHRLPSPAFPAVAHATLARTGARRPGDLEARLRVLAAVATGRV